MDSDALTSTRGQVAYRRLRELILEGTFPPGTPLQENMLAAKIGVSRTPVREALAQLISEGLVSRVAGLTPVVRGLSADDLVEILHLRRLLEVEAASSGGGLRPWRRSGCHSRAPAGFSCRRAADHRGAYRARRPAPRDDREAVGLEPPRAIRAGSASPDKSIRQGAAAGTLRPRLPRAHRHHRCGARR